MGLFKKKTDYSYYSSYSSSRRRLKVGRTVIAVIAAAIAASEGTSLQQWLLF